MTSILPRYGEIESNTPDGLHHRVRWTEWGDPLNNQVLFCAHGLSRNGRDFDYLAHALARQYRVICPDYPGRGSSDWLANPTFYNHEQYLYDSLKIIGKIRYHSLDWVGTSMGGIIGMSLAALDNNPISRMVVNDVGPYIPAKALAEIGKYLENHPRFNSLQDANEYYRTIYSGFGHLSDETYDHFVEHGVKQADTGHGYMLNYDPAIVSQFTSVKPADIVLWDIWDRIKIPILIIRGQKSDLLLVQTVEQMKHRHSGAESVEFENCAHAPSLMEKHQIDTIVRWLENKRPANRSG